MRRPRLLHIADPHFTNCHYSGDPALVGERQAREIISTLKEGRRLGSGFDFLVLSGDFTWSCNTDGFVAADAFIRALYPLLSEDGLIIVPGNHDVFLGNSPFHLGKLALPVQKEEIEAEYRKFLDRLGPLVDSPNAHLSVAKRLEISNQDRGLVLMGLNSCRVERRDAQGWGYVGPDQIYALASTLNDPNNPNAARDNDVVIAVVHHNPLPIWDLGLETLTQRSEERKFSFMMDTGSTLSFLTDLGVEAILHGHTHVASDKRVEGYGLEPKTNALNLLVLGSGSLGIVPHSGDSAHHFQIIEVELARNTVQGAKEFGATLWVENFFSLASRPNTVRKWHGQKPQPRYLTGCWNSERTKNALARRQVQSHAAAQDIDRAESWSELRHKVAGARWPDIRKAIIQRVRALAPFLLDGDVANAIEDLFIDPPSENEVIEWRLETFLARRLSRK